LKLVSDSQTAEMGAPAFAQMRQQQTVSRDARINSYVRCVTDAITRTLDSPYKWQVEVFQDDSANAFALPGGHIGVHTGLLAVAQDQHQLAAVIGHEIAHVMAEHSAAQVSNQLATQLGVQALAGMSGVSPEIIGMGANLLLVMPYGRRDESEADAIGLQYMAEAGFDPRAAVALWHNMAAQSGGGRSAEFLSTHPAPATRIRDLEQLMPQALPAFQQAQARGVRPACR
ncbi:MAG: M48 family metallopeptidase, partial [Gammaproteobacteria bacterium]